MIWQIKHIVFNSRTEVVSNDLTYLPHFSKIIISFFFFIFNRVVSSILHIFCFFVTFRIHEQRWPYLSNLSFMKLYNFVSNWCSKYLFYLQTMSCNWRIFTNDTIKQWITLFSTSILLQNKEFINFVTVSYFHEWKLQYVSY